MSEIPLHLYHKYIQQWLEEDVPSFDIAGDVALQDHIIKVAIVCKESCIVAGIPLVIQIFRYLECPYTCLRFKN